jgi:hypothetical protein
MSNETCTVTIADIYGAQWWERNKEELEREWEWEFGVAGAVKVAHVATPDIQEFSWYMPDGRTAPRIILHRRKPKPPTLREVYGVDEVTVRRGMEWTQEFRNAGPEEKYYASYNCIGVGPTCAPRLILRERPKKVWFKAEEKARIANFNDWIWDLSMEKWVKLEYGGGFHLCATRHEEVDQTVQVVTQEDIDKCGH